MKNLFIAIGLVLSVGINTTFAQQAETESTEYRETAEIKNALVHTKLKVSFDIPNQKLFGEEWLTAKPHFYDQKTLVLDAKGMDIHAVQMNAKDVKYVYEKDVLTITLDKSYSKNQEFTVYIKYTANPDRITQSGSAAITDAKGLYFINPKGEEANKPTQIWTQGETESSSCWFPTIDKPNQKTSQELYITVPNKFLTLSNGELVSKTPNSNGTRTDYWKFNKKHAPYLFFMGIGEYAVIKDKWKNIEVDYYVEKDYENVAKDIFGLTPEMIEFFSNRLAYEFPWNKYSQIVCRDYVSGAMENTTAVIFGEFVQQKKGHLVDENIAEAVVAHELFHHWFGDLVTTESWSNLTVNESFANYSEYLWLEHKYGKEAAEFHRHNEIKGYKLGDNFKKDLVRFHYNSREDMFDGVSYNKGGAILHMLRNYLGDEAFFAGMSKYLKDNEYKAAEAHHFRLALEEVSGKDLSWFFNQWYYNFGHPKVKIVHSYNASTKKVDVTLVQDKEKLFQFPFIIDVFENGTPKRTTVWIKAEETSQISIPVSNKPQTVIFNADQSLLCDLEENKSIDEYISQLQLSKEYKDKLLAIEFLSNKQTTQKKAFEALLKACEDSFFRTRLDALQHIDVSNSTYIQLAEPILMKLAKNDTKTLVQAKALEILNANSSAPIKDLLVALKNSPSYSVQGQVALGLLKVDENMANEYINSLDMEAYSGDILYKKVDSWIAENDTAKSPKLAELAAFYAFTKFEDATKGKIQEKAFNWIMENGNNEANSAMVTMYKQVLQQYKDNEMVKKVVTEIVTNAIAIKKKAIENKVPHSSILQTQIIQLENVIK